MSNTMRDNIFQDRYSSTSGLDTLRDLDSRYESYLNHAIRGKGLVGTAIGAGAGMATTPIIQRIIKKKSPDGRLTKTQKITSVVLPTALGGTLGYLGSKVHTNSYIKNKVGSARERIKPRYESSLKSYIKDKKRSQEEEEKNREWNYKVLY